MEEEEEKRDRDGETRKKIIEGKREQERARYPLFIIVSIARVFFSLFFFLFSLFSLCFFFFFVYLLISASLFFCSFFSLTY